MTEPIETLHELMAEEPDDTEEVEVEAPSMPDAPPSAWISGGSVIALLGVVTTSDNPKVQVAAVVAAGVVAAIDRLGDAWIRHARNKYK